MIKIDIISDTVCPWCYIGKKRLDKALTIYKRHQFDITWHAFQLNPSMPQEGMDRKLYLSSKFGGDNRAEDIYNQAREIYGAKVQNNPDVVSSEKPLHKIYSFYK